MRETKAVLIRKAVVGYPAIAEHKVAGEVYIPGVDAVPGHPGEVHVTMTVDEAEKVMTILGDGVCLQGGVPTPDEVYMTLSELFKGARKYRMHSANPANPDAGWPYLIRL